MVVSVPAALVDVNLGGRLHILTAIAFIGTCALSAVLVRRCDLKAVVVMPPLMFVLLAGVSAVITGGGDLRTRALLLISTVVLGAPILMSATIVTAVVAGLRLALRRN
jgi:hypothetical protein